MSAQLETPLLELIARGTFLFVLFMRGGQLIIPWDETFTAWQAGPTVPGQGFGARTTVIRPHIP
ncbi:hypothetical protein [Paracoccus aerius]|uniref:DoxX family protein n=1 Tax=Paracoccus aerius TaxID=1915382 RepID=A0ABS1SD79_9RHOB|nr:hypothetical protein [Paracoccus aerius]MBL3675652.1 hypothetical protein [Paracoccus aerius]GHG36187.1 hypothetical protein GCM10017322_38820 [Paracoccus aerius]